MRIIDKNDQVDKAGRVEKKVEMDQKIDQNRTQAVTPDQKNTSADQKARNSIYQRAINEANDGDGLEITQGRSKKLNSVLDRVKNKKAEKSSQTAADQAPSSSLPKSNISPKARLNNQMAKNNVYMGVMQQTMDAFSDVKFTLDSDMWRINQKSAAQQI